MSKDTSLNLEVIPYPIVNRIEPDLHKVPNATKVEDIHAIHEIENIHVERKETPWQEHAVENCI